MHYSLNSSKGQGLWEGYKPHECIHFTIYCLVTGTQRSKHISPVLRQLHWLLVCQCVDFKVATLVHQLLSGISPPYLADDCRLVADACERRLRSTASRTCIVTRTYSNFGDRAFGAAGPGLWNSLLSHLKDVQWISAVTKDISVWTMWLNSPHMQRVTRVNSDCPSLSG